MDTHINLRALQYADLMELGKLAAEAMALSHEYDRSRAHAYCELVAACNVEMLTRRQRAARDCGKALSSPVRGSFTRSSRRRAPGSR